MTASKHLPSVVLPKNAKVIRVQKKSPLIENLGSYITSETAGGKPLAFVVPLVDCDVPGKYTPVPIGGERHEEQVSLSHYDITSVNICSRVCFAFEDIWGVL